MRGCPATGRMAHVFDKTTHRCRCGRWERGHKPKSAPVRPRNECQICERQQSLDASGCLGHHGYRRPGCGFIQGDCMGVGYQPYPATDALCCYLSALDNHLASLRQKLAELPASDSIVYTYKVYVVGHRGEQRTRILKRGDVGHYDVDQRVSFPSFADRVHVEMGKVRLEIQQVERERRRVVDRIDKVGKG